METPIKNQTPTLAGKRVVILGGSAGFGLATAKIAAGEGAQVVIISGNQQRINQALQQLPASAQGIACDLSLEINIKNLFDGLGNFDHLVYTAAENLTLNTVADTVIDEAKKFLGLRVWSAYAAVKYGAPYINAGGSISLSSGIAGMRPGPGWSIASFICSGMEGLVRALAVELAPIRVNSVVPAMVRSNLWDSFPETEREAMFKSVGDSYLAKRIGEPEDIALAFIYMMKQQFGTGQNLVIDGGAVLV